MKKISLIGIIIFLLFTSLIGCSTTKETKEKKVEKRNVHLVAVGDSLTVGLKGTNGGYVRMIEERLNQQPNVQKVTVDNYAIVGNRTEQLMNRLEEKAVQTSIKNADFIVLTIGGNDMMKTIRKNILSLKMKDFDEAKKEYDNQLHLIFKTLRSLNKKAPIYYIGLYNPFEKTLSQVPEIGTIIESYNDVAKSATKDYDNIRYVSVFDDFSNSKKAVVSEDDQFHPNDNGYEIMADAVWKEMKKDF